MTHASATDSTDATDLESAVLGYVDDPLGFVLFNWPWGQPGPLEGYDGPDQWQADILRTLGDEVTRRRGDKLGVSIQIAVASGHGVGKSALIAWLIIWFMACRPGPQIPVTANTKEQLLGKTWRELAKWHKLARTQAWFEWTATRFFLAASPSTWFASALAWSKDRPEAFAGTHDEYVLVVYDEASAIADVIWEVTEGAMTTPGAIWIVFGNPTKNTGRFKECFGRFRSQWITRQIDSRSAKMANSRQIERWIDAYGDDSDFVRVRVKGVFPRAGSAQFIPTDRVEAAQARTVDVPPGSPRLLGVDVARFGDDQTVIARVHGRKLEPLERYRGLDTMQTAAIVAKIMRDERPDATFVDGVGLGAGVVDRLRQLGHPVIEVNGGESADTENKGTHYNKRIEMWDRMKEWLRAADIPAEDKELGDDLIGPEYGFDAKMRLQLERKEDMKARGLASPDAGDALALCFAYATPPIMGHSQAELEPEAEEVY